MGVVVSEMCAQGSGRGLTPFCVQRAQPQAVREDPVRTGRAAMHRLLHGFAFFSAAARGLVVVMVMMIADDGALC